MKVDVNALPAGLVKQLQQKQLDLDDRATTVALLKLDAILGVKGFVNKEGQLLSVGITCAICHSTVDDSFAPGIGHRLDCRPNRDLNIGKIISLAPDLKLLTDRLGVDEGVLKKVLTAWGPGKYDAELLHDGKAVRPDGKTAATLLPPAFGQAGLNSHTYTGWGSVSHWNAYVANTHASWHDIARERYRRNPAHGLCLATRNLQTTWLVAYRFNSASVGTATSATSDVGDGLTQTAQT